MNESAKQITELGNIFNQLDRIEAKMMNIAGDKAMSCLAREMISHIRNKINSMNELVTIVEKYNE